MLAVNELKNLTVPELKKALLERGLNVVGKKQDLINRLTAYLETEEEEKQESPVPEAVTEAPKTSPVKTAKTDTQVPETTETKENAAPEPEVAAAPAKALKDMTDEEKKQLRAEKFGLSTPSNDEIKKAARAERFGVVLSSSTSASPGSIKQNDVSVDPDTLKRRAERFGQVTNSKLAKIEVSEKKEERAKRFGIPSTDPAVETAAKEARAKRFEGQLGNVDDEMKKKRAERFGVITAA